MKMSFTKPPSLQRTLDAMSKLHRHFHGMSLLTGENSHRATAVVEAANHAFRQGVLFASCWKNNKHHAAACFELSKRAMASKEYRQSNVQIQVDIDYSVYRRHLISTNNETILSYDKKR